MANCIHHNCLKKVYINVKWGTDNQKQEANLCQDHMQELWVALNPLLQVNKAWIILDKPKVA
jgi:hypothetical protein